MRLHNAASLRARQWVDVCIEGNGVGDVGEVAGFLAIGGPRQGAGRIYHVLAELDARTGTSGDLTASSSKAPPFRWSKWVSDAYTALVPKIGANIDGQNYITPIPTFWNKQGDQPESFVQVLDENPARQLWHARAVDGRLVLDCWGRIYSDQDVVELEMQVGIKHPDGVTVAAVEDLHIFTSEPLHVDYRNRKGIEEPVFSEGRWMTRVWQDRRDWGRAQLIEIEGALLCLPTDMSQFGQAPQSRLDAMQARTEAPIFAASEWNEWMAFKRVAEQPGDLDEEIGDRSRRFAESLRNAGDIAEVRPYGLAENPGQAGDQEDFGASKGVLASLGDPFSTWQYRYHAEGWAMRPEHNVEPTGEPVKAADHPQCKQWSHIPDPRQGRGDLLGWPVDRPYGWFNRRLGNWKSIDDQHYSGNLLCAALQLTGSPALSRCVDDLLELDVMRVKPRLGNVRAVGRRLLFWAHVMAVGNDKQRERARWLINDLMEDFGDADLIKNGFFGTSAEIQVVAPHNGKYGWEVDDAWIVWMEGLCVMGLYAAGIQTGNQTYKDYAKAIARTITKYGVFYEGGQWHCCYGVRSVLDSNGNHTGVSIPAGDYTTANRDNVYTWGSWAFGTLPAILIFRELADATDPDLPRADAVISSIVGDRPRSWNWAEWLACGSINRVEPPEPPDPPGISFEPGVRVGRVESADLTECSGIVADGQSFWAHNDSGDLLRLFRMTEAGISIGVYTVAGARPLDNEDIAIYDGHLYVGDIGHAKIVGGRKDISIWKVPIGSPNGPAEEIRLTYPDGARADSETLFMGGRGVIHIVEKAIGGRVWVSFLPHQELMFVGRLPESLGTIVGGDKRDGWTVLRTYSKAYVWRSDTGRSLLETIPDATVDLIAEPQGEAICWANDLSGFYTTSEGRNQPIIFYRRSGSAPR